MPDFIPPQVNPLTLGLVKAIMPLALKLEKLEIRPSAHCLQVIKSFQDRPVVLAVNHIDRCDPSVVAALSLKCREDYYYLAARELFDENMGMRGWLMQHSGVYSVIRGNPEDVESKEKTIALIAEGQHKLVMFPEGDVTGRDDSLAPLKRDGIRNMLEAQKLCLERGPKRAVSVIPVAIYYEVNENAMQPLKDCLTRLEVFLGQTVWSGPMEARIQRLLYSMLRQMEDHYGLESAQQGTDVRIDRLCRHITDSVANVTGSQALQHSDLNTYVYSVRGKLQRLKDDKTDYPGSFDGVLRKENLKRFETSTQDLERVQNLLILASTLQQRPASLDVLWRIIDRMETLIVGKPSAKGNRTAWIEAGQPISLLTSVADYYLDQVSTIERTEGKLRLAMQEVLDTLKERSLPLQQIA